MRGDLPRRCDISRNNTEELEHPTKVRDCSWDVLSGDQAGIGCSCRHALSLEEQKAILGCEFLRGIIVDLASVAGGHA